MHGRHCVAAAAHNSRRRLGRRNQSDASTARAENPLRGNCRVVGLCGAYSRYSLNSWRFGENASRMAMSLGTAQFALRSCLTHLQLDGLGRAGKGFCFQLIGVLEHGRAARGRQDHLVGGGRK